jgi:Putative lumazine-binding
MKNIVLILIFLFTTFIQAQNKEVQQTIETFFDGFHQRDSIKIKSVCAEKMILQSISEGKKGAKLENEKPSEFYKSIATIPNDMQFEEKILKYQIQVDGTMAHAWTPYEFYSNGKLSHSGVNAFTLFKENESWKIIYIIDTRRK